MVAVLNDDVTDEMGIVSLYPPVRRPHRITTHILRALTLTLVLGSTAPLPAQVDTTRSTQAPLRPALQWPAATRTAPELQNESRPPDASSWLAAPWPRLDSSTVALTLPRAVFTYGFAGAFSAASHHRHLARCEPFHDSLEDAVLHGALVGVVIGTALGILVPESRSAGIAGRIFGTRSSPNALHWCPAGRGSLP